MLQTKYVFPESDENTSNFHIYAFQIFRKTFENILSIKIIFSKTSTQITAPDDGLTVQCSFLIYNHNRQMRFKYWITQTSMLSTTVCTSKLYFMRKYIKNPFFHRSNLFEEQGDNWQISRSRFPFRPSYTPASVYIQRHKFQKRSVIYWLLYRLKRSENIWQNQF